MISSTLLFTTAFALANAASPSSAASAAKLEISGVPQDYVNYGLEVAAIQFANYRNSDVSHQDAVQVARDGFTLYLEQAPIQNLVAKAFEYYSQNADAFNTFTWTPPSADFNLQVVQAVAAANKELASQPGYDSLTQYLKEHLTSFDLGAGLSDIHNLARINPDNARKGVAKAQSKVAENEYNQEAYASAVSMAKDFAQSFGVNGSKVQQAWNQFVAMIY